MIPLVGQQGLHCRFICDTMKAVRCPEMMIDNKEFFKSEPYLVSIDVDQC